MSDADSMSGRRITIERMKPVPPAEDFAALKAQALQLLPVWCEGIWSDFNDHDPGIMILEQVTYALTELAYRANLPMGLLLKHAPSGSVSWGENSLYAPTEVLPMAPMTTEDYARFLYDNLPELAYANVEVMPRSGLAVAPGIAGRLRARIAMRRQPPPLPPPGGKADEPLPDPTLRNARELLDRHCNLGERFEIVEWEPEMAFAMAFEAKLAPGVDVRETADALYRAVILALQPGPTFRTLHEALETETIDRALTGPKLDGGVIADTDLPRLITWAEAQARSAQALRSVAGVRSIDRLEFSLTTATAVEGHHWFVPLGEVKIALPKDATEAQLTWFMSFGHPTDFSAPIGPEAVRGGLPTHQRSTSLQPPPPKIRFAQLLPTPTWKMPPVPDEAITSVGEYYSIQNQFPPCFGLQSDGAPPDANVAREAEIRQLKGYLLVFEQLLANYFAQLEHTSDYFSNHTQHRTVFEQPLATVPGVLPLLDGYNFDDANADSAVRAAHAEAYWDDKANPYVTALRASVEDDARFLRRRSRVLDQLLARFNESYLAAPNQATYETIRNKEALLRAYERIGYDRARSADQTAAADPAQRRAQSGLERKLQLLLRRDSQPKPPPLGELSPVVRPKEPADFYFAIEPIRFLPRPGPGYAGAIWEVPVASFQPALFHVMINWTYRPLDAAFIAYGEDLVRENTPLHLESRFIWLETQFPKDIPPGPERANLFIALFQRWALTGYAALRLGAPTVGADAATLPVIAEDPAAQLFRWLLAEPRLPT